jgi:hypothetical protein
MHFGCMHASFCLTSFCLYHAFTGVRAKSLRRFSLSTSPTTNIRSQRPYATKASARTFYLHSRPQDPCFYSTFSTTTPALITYQEATVSERSRSIKSATFSRTWCLDKGTGLPTTTPPTTYYGKLNYL